MTRKPVFPTKLHQDTAELIRDYFLTVPGVDTVLVVNSCARGQAVPESDLDFAILTKADVTPDEAKKIESYWQTYLSTQPLFSKFKESHQFAHLHLDIINGTYTPGILGSGEPIDYFEIEIGNQICYSAPMGSAGPYFKELQNKWLPYYNEELSQQRFALSQGACEYDLDHIPFFMKRELYFQSLEILFKGFQEYLQTLFISKKVYPIAYNKWIKEQIVKWLNLPDLYAKLPPILSISNMESNEIIEKANMLRQLLNDLRID